METFNKQVFDAVLGARHLTLANVSQRLGLREAVLERQITSGPDAQVLKALSAELRVPDFVFFMDRPPELARSLVDFRSAAPSIAAMSKETVATIDMAQAIQGVAERLGYRDALRRGLTESTLLESAPSIRKQLRISFSDQRNAKDAAVFYSICRRAVEATGVFVIQDSFPAEDGSGFCLADSPARMIVVNTRNQTPGRRAFTLMHELAHALLAKTGVSDPFVTKNTTERLCNRFAAQVLAPKSLAEAVFLELGIGRSPTPGEIKLASKALNISQEATVVRFVQLKLVDPTSHQTWLDAVRRQGGNPDWLSRRGGGRNVAQEKVKLSRFGFTFAKVFGDAVAKESLSPLSLYRLSGLKPKYQQPYFSFAESAGPDDVEP